MSLRLEQNWKWSSKTFLHTLCAVKPWCETTCFGIFLVSDANLHWAPEGEVQAWNYNIFSRFFTTKLDFCYLNFSKNIQLFKNPFVSQQSITFRLHKTCVTFSRSTSLTAAGDYHWKKGNVFGTSWKNNRFDQIFFQLVFWFISKMTIYWHISSFADLFVLKTPRAIHGKPFAWYTYEKFAFFVCVFVHRYLFSK